jgi:hypothetical protein
MRSALVVTLAAAFAAATSAVPAYAATFPIELSSPGVRPGEEFTVSGQAPCGERAYTVTLAYKAAHDDTATATATGSTDAQGGFSQVVAAPEDSVGDESATVTVDVACDEPATSEAETIVIAAWQEQLAVSAASGRAGDTVQVQGRLCHGGEVEVLFLESEGTPSFPVEVTLDDGVFDGDYVVPDVPVGDYGFVARCPGTMYEFAPFGVYATEDPPLSVDGPPVPEDPEGVPASPLPNVVSLTG